MPPLGFSDTVSEPSLRTLSTSSASSLVIDQLRASREAMSHSVQHARRFGDWVGLSHFSHFSAELANGQTSSFNQGQIGKNWKFDRSVHCPLYVDGWTIIAPPLS